MREGSLKITFISNAGLLIQYHNTTFLLDGLYGTQGHIFSPIPETCLNDIFSQKRPFGQVDYLLFSHLHPDHFSEELVADYIESCSVKGICYPDTPGVPTKKLVQAIQKNNVYCVLLSESTDSSICHIDSHISIRTISTRHLSPDHNDIPHICYLLSFDEKNILFTSDVDYLSETFERLNDITFDSIFINPFFLRSLHKKPFFQGSFHTKSFCVYHIPAPEEDSMLMRNMVARDLSSWTNPNIQVTGLFKPLQSVSF